MNGVSLASSGSHGQRIEVVVLFAWVNHFHNVRVIVHGSNAVHLSQDLRIGGALRDSDNRTD